MERDSASASSSDPAPRRVPPLDWAQHSGRAGAVTRAIDDFVRRQRRRRALTGAAALAAISCGLFVVQKGTGWMEREPARAAVAVATTVTAPARQTLPDGSVVELRPGAEIEVEFTAAGPELRRVVLRRGEAHFTVAKNPQRPFVVLAEGVEVRAVGTAFAVDRAAGKVEVLVTEGKVAVDRPAALTPVSPAAERSPLAELGAGDCAVVAIDGDGAKARVASISAEEFGARLAWRVPRLEFNATPLAEVIALFNRHSVTPRGRATTRLVLADASLGALPLSGMLRADNVAVLLQIIDSAYGIRAEHETEGTIVLLRAR